MTEQHHHTWVHATDQPAWPTRYACTDCVASTPGCVVCNRIFNTIGRTCPDCISKARNDLRSVRDMYRDLPDVIASVAGLHAVRYDQRGSGKVKKPTDTPIIGGSAFVMAAPGNYGTSAWSKLGDSSHTADNLPTDPPSLLAVLTSWEDTWRLEQRQHAADRTSVDAAVEYLLVHTTWAAQHSDDWAGYIRDLRDLTARLANLTGNDARPVRSDVPCPYCAGTIEQQWRDAVRGKDGKPEPGTGGLDDVHRCTGCGISWASEAHFRLAIREAHQALPDTHPDQLVTVEDARRILKPRGVRPNLLALWVHRDERDRERYERDVAAGGTPVVPTLRLPEARGRDVRGADLYRLGDLVERTLGTTRSDDGDTMGASAS